MVKSRWQGQTCSRTETTAMTLRKVANLVCKEVSLKLSFGTFPLLCDSWSRHLCLFPSFLSSLENNRIITTVTLSDDPR